jgi:hypothetical protein
VLHWDDRFRRVTARGELGCWGVGVLGMAGWAPTHTVHGSSTQMWCLFGNHARGQRWENGSQV